MVGGSYMRHKYGTVNKIPFSFQLTSWIHFVVLNFVMPKTAEQYTHRVGRTARGGQAVGGGGKLKYEHSPVK